MDDLFAMSSYLRSLRLDLACKRISDRQIERISKIVTYRHGQEIRELYP